jgi:segregation and condensation protein B
MALTLSARIEAVLFAAGEPLTKKRLGTLLEAAPQALEDGLNALAISLTDRGLALMTNGEEVELRTRPDASDAVQKLRESELSRELGKASLEAMAYILYKGSATRGEIDWLRGVNSAAAIRSLTLRGLIERSDDPADKRRARYTPTMDALAALGVANREALPRFAEFSGALASQEAKAASAGEDL